MFPDSIDVDSVARDCFELLVEQEKHGANPTFPSGITFNAEGYGEGRTVYDISDYSTHEAVVKVACNNYGLQENRREIHDRTQWPRELQEHLVPCLDSGHDGHWAIQPKITTTLSQRQRDAVLSELQSLVEKHNGDQREVYIDNIGVYNDTYVICDHGGL